MGDCATAGTPCAPPERCDAEAPPNGLTGQGAARGQDPCTDAPMPKLTTTDRPSPTPAASWLWASATAGALTQAGHAGVALPTTMVGVEVNSSASAAGVVAIAALRGGDERLTGPKNWLAVSPLSQNGRSHFGSRDCYIIINMDVQALPNQPCSTYQINNLLIPIRNKNK